MQWTVLHLDTGAARRRVTRGRVREAVFKQREGKKGERQLVTCEAQRH